MKTTDRFSRVYISMHKGMVPDEATWIIFRDPYGRLLGAGLAVSDEVLHECLKAMGVTKKRLPAKLLIAANIEGASFESALCILS